MGDADLKTVMSFAERILDRPVEVIDGVRDTLEYLAPRHDLTLFTKGHPDEQQLKIDRSGLRGFFTYASIVPEKDSPAYSRLVETRGMAPESSWMVGNSPRSDINPALEAGLNAVFVPHTQTWSHEWQEIRSGKGRLLVVERFVDLQRHF